MYTEFQCNGWYSQYSQWSNSVCCVLRRWTCTCHLQTDVMLIHYLYIAFMLTPPTFAFSNAYSTVCESNLNTPSQLIPNGLSNPSTTSNHSSTEESMKSSFFEESMSLLIYAIRDKFSYGHHFRKFYWLLDSFCFHLFFYPLPLKFVTNVYPLIKPLQVTKKTVHRIIITVV